MKILVDHNMVGHARRLWGTLTEAGWVASVPLELLTFADVGLSIESSDRVVWRFTQEHQMLLLTGNRRMEGDDSLEQTLREENSAESLPVINVGSVERLMERDYRDRCMLRLIEIVLYIDTNRGTRRLFIP